MKRIRKRWRYIGWACVTVAVFWLAMFVIEVWSKL